MNNYCVLCIVTLETNSCMLLAKVYSYSVVAAYLLRSVFADVVKQEDTRQDTNCEGHYGSVNTGITILKMITVCCHGK